MAECREEMENNDFLTEDCSMKRHGFFVKVDVSNDKGLLEDIVDEYAGVKLKYDDDFVGVDNPFSSTAALVHMG